tara:strand:+ start:124 stop:405 length:282 start_codon:yes stop_codon:yes gene_type:complete
MVAPVKVKVKGRLSTAKLSLVEVERSLVHNLAKEKTRIQEGAARDLNPTTAAHAFYNEVYTIVLNATPDRVTQSVGCILLLSYEEVRSRRERT